MNTFPSLDAFSALYPEGTGLLHHALADHPMFTLKALVALAARMRPADVEYSRGDLPVGVDPSANIANGLSIGDTIRGIEENGSWMVLKFVEQDATYRTILRDSLAGLMPVVRPMTGPMLKQEGFIFISSPNAVTPFHFDPEHNILLQLRGAKTMTVFPAGDETVVAAVEHERFHIGGHRNLPWHEDLALKGRTFHLQPGDGIYVPVKAPHWVKNGPDVSISFSITWRSAWSYREADARGFNSVLRKAGITPQTTHRFPHRNLGKSLAYRALRRLGRR